MGQDVRQQLRTHYDETEVRQRADRPLGTDRTRVLSGFLDHLRARELSSVLEIGSGAGRDGVAIKAAGLTYTGVDLSPAAADYCVSRGLDAREADATALPFAADEFDAAWSMSTLMHLPGEEFAAALEEIARVVRPDGLVEVGLWGHTSSGERTAPDGRLFCHRSDDDLRSELARIGTILDFDTWDWMEGGGHYQWARLVVRKASTATDSPAEEH